MTTHSPASSTAAPVTADVPPGLALLPLLQTLREIAADPDLHQLVDLEHPERQSLEFRSTPDLQVWLLTWPPGFSTGWHDHGESRGAYATLRGRLTERTWALGDPTAWYVGRGESRAYTTGHVHEVRNETTTTALSVHAYAPRLTTMTRYVASRGRLEVVGVEQAGVQL